MCVCFVRIYSTYLLFEDLEVNESFLYIFHFCVCVCFFLVNYSLDFNEDSLHRNTVPVKDEPIMAVESLLALLHEI